MRGMLSKAVILFVWGCSLKHRQKPFWVVDSAVHHFKEVSFYFYTFVKAIKWIDVLIYIFLTFL